MNFEVRVEDAEVLAAVRRMIVAASQPQPALREIADLGESSTRMRFRTQKGPDGTAWQKGWKKSGRTLTRDGHLAGSISSRATLSEATWGVNRVYAAIHQFGGTIRAKGKALKFKVPGGEFAVVKAVRMPARPFLGISKDDREDILQVVRRHLGGGELAG